jgi:hypothetical protein
VNTEALILLCHEGVHNAEHNPEDTVFFSLTRKDVWLVCLSVLVMGESFDCLDDESADILDRLAEVAEIQKAHWRGNNGPD